MSGRGRGGDETPPLHAPQSIFLDTPLTSNPLEELIALPHSELAQEEGME